MLVVDRSRVGDVAFSRLVREGLVHDAVGAWALPHDIRSTRALRAHLIAPLVPGHTWLTGLALLWLEGLCGPPDVVDLAAARGAHRTEPSPGSPVLAFHTARVWGIDPRATAPPRVTVTRACLDALAHSAPWVALPATASALRRRATTIPKLTAALKRLDSRTTNWSRVKGLVEALATL